ncbi:hypothetical protein [Natronococcus roseus]|uniref:hypothetical protein n=1 Tax=Natronococcus roseus TaxID=1052014 RepID=UPI00374D635F
MGDDSTEFHPEADPEATDLEGDRQYGIWGQCTTSNRHDKRCGAPALGPHGKCHYHGGATPTKEENEDVGAPEGNGNAAKHNLTSDHSKLYDRLRPDLQAEVDKLRDEMLEDIAARRGLDRAPFYLRPPARRVAMNMLRVTYFAENWEGGDEANENTENPLVEERLVDYDPELGATYRKGEGVAQDTARKLSNENRQWLKDFGLLDSPEDRIADSTEEVGEAIMGALTDSYE